MEQTCRTGPEFVCWVFDGAVWLNEKLVSAQNNPRQAAAVIDICNKGAQQGGQARFTNN
jgi:hypothetical protein